ncbi:hypothetical protein V6N11_015890 [Hibiscus sabdariffa]|uniref:Protein transport protein SEC23 n=1 Tax=Hibiscus sabdariffa TaxID=183260 RepID=A0ABR2TTF7_9ROSI
MHASKEVAHLIFSSLRPNKLNVPETSRDRIIVCAGGPNTYGLGSVPCSYTHPKEKSALKWMEHLGREAHQQNTVVDILCAGQLDVAVQGFLCCSLLQKFQGIRCSDDIQVVSPGEEAHIDTHETFKNDISLCIQMLSVEETQCFWISMENKHDIKSDFVFFLFQFVIQYLNVYQADITRVVTIRLPTVDSVPEYLQSVEDGVAVVLITKRTVLAAKSYSDVFDMHTTIDERVKDVALKFSSQVPKTKLHRFPKEISLLPELLFHLRQGPLLGNIVCHEEERSVL